MAKQIVAVVGTDTDVGKTYTCCQLLKYLGQSKQVVGLKPLAAGCELTEIGEINSDTYNHYQYSNVKLPLSQITPFGFKPAIAPHLAASQAQQSLTVALMHDKIRELVTTVAADIILIEGAGGVMVPLNYQETYLDLLQALNFSTIIVVGVRLGCLNHALLTRQALTASKVPTVGFIANCIDPHLSCLTENITTLSKMLDCPLVGSIGYQQSFMPTAAFGRLFND